MMATIISASALILLLAALRPLLRGRVDPRLQYALWLLVALRLLIPVPLFPSPVSLSDAAAEVQQSVAAQYPASRPWLGEPRADAPAAQPIVPGVPADTAPAQPAEEATAAVNWPLLVWGAGAALTAAALLGSDLVFRHRLRRSRRPLAAEDLPISVKTPVYLAEDLASPCLFGLLPPAIYLNGDALEEGRLTHILVHEQTHLRHGDHLWALLRGLCLTLRWYNPLVWWAALLSRRDSELACDAGAIHHLGETQRLAYGRTLLAMVSPGRSLGGLLGSATTMSAGKRTMAQRIKLIARRPQTVWITLVALALIVCAVVAVTFGGHTAEEESPDAPPAQSHEAPAQPLSPSVPAPGITKAEALALYQNARAAWDWFALGSLPLDAGDTCTQGRDTYHRVQGFPTLADLRAHLLTLFSPDLADHLLTAYQPLLEKDGNLYAIPAQRGSSIYAGEESVQVFLPSPADAAQYGYDGHIYATTAVLDQSDLSTVLYNKRHDWFFVWNGEHYVFTSFGPWDDVDPQKYDNAITILDYCRQGGTIISWQPLLRDFDWNALEATRSQWTAGVDLGEYILSAIQRFIADEGSNLSAVAFQDILSATEGLDGAYAEGFSAVVWQLYALAPAQFARTALEALTAEQQAAVVQFLAGELAYHLGQEDTLPAGEVLDRLEKTLAGDPVPVAPSTVYAYFTHAGETARLTPVGVQGRYAAEFSSADPAVAAVDDRDGTITAVGPGETTVSLHVECSAGQFDFTCQVVCQWVDSPAPQAGSQPEAPAATEDWEIINSLTRSYAPAAMAAGSPAALTIDLAEDWSLEAIRSALWEALTDYVAGTALEGDLHAVNISYSFQFPAELTEGMVLTVPYTAVYQDEPHPLPSGKTFAPQVETEELTASVRLVGQGSGGQVDGDFAAGQALYRQLSACAQVETLTVQAGSQESILPLLSATIDENLAAAGLAGKYYRSATTLAGPFLEPAALAPGDTQEIEYTVTLAPADGLQEAMTFTGVLTCTAQ